MPSQIDHIVIAVRNLDDASKNYAKAGFTVIPGGEHVGGATHNALVSFNDGAYFELIAFKNPDQAPTPPHRWWEKLSKGEGLVDYALLSSDLGVEANELTDRGLTVDGPHNGGRVRPDGQRVAWRTLRSAQDGAPLPFLIDDQTPRPLRVPNGPATEHPSGYTGVAGVAIGVADLETAKQAYSKLLGTPGEAVTPSVPGAQSAWRFSFGDHWVELVQPDDQPGALRDQINARGEGPVEITVKTASSGNERYLPFDTTNGVRIKVV